MAIIFPHLNLEHKIMLLKDIGICSVCERGNEIIREYGFNLEPTIIDPTTGITSINSEYKTIVICGTDYNMLVKLRARYFTATRTIPSPDKSIELIKNYRRDNPIRKVIRRLNVSYCKSCGNITDESNKCAICIDDYIS